VSTVPYTVLQQHVCVVMLANANVILERYLRSRVLHVLYIPGLHHPSLRRYHTPQSTTVNRPTHTNSLRSRLPVRGTYFLVPVSPTLSRLPLGAAHTLQSSICTIVFLSPNTTKTQSWLARVCLTYSVATLQIRQLITLPSQIIIK